LRQAGCDQDCGKRNQSNEYEQPFLSNLCHVTVFDSFESFA
jgi:hypothetical protein